MGYIQKRQWKSLFSFFCWSDFVVGDVRRPGSSNGSAAGFVFYLVFVFDQEGGRAPGFYGTTVRLQKGRPSSGRSRDDS